MIALLITLLVLVVAVIALLVLLSRLGMLGGWDGEAPGRLDPLAVDIVVGATGPDPVLDHRFFSGRVTMTGFGQLLGFLVWVLPAALWDWIMGHQICPQCRGPNKQPNCHLCGGRGKIKRR